MGFTINIAKGLKKISSNTKPNRISRLCIGTTIKDGNTYKIRISLRNDPDFPDYIVIPFTKRSLDLKGKSIVYGCKKDNLGRIVKYCRDKSKCELFPGLPTQYTVVVEKVVCSGYVIRKDGKLLFDLLDTHGIGNLLYNLPNRLDESKPLFPSKK